MDKKAFDQVETRLSEVNKIIEKLDSSIRVAAFEFLKPYIAGGTIKVLHTPKDEGGGGADGGAPDDLAEMVEKFIGDDEPSDNVKLLSAWWFSQYGSAPFSMAWIKSTGSSSGLTIPNKPDMTFRQAKENGKTLYEALGKGGLIKPTIIGEKFLKTKYGVRKGTKPTPTKAK